MPSLALDAEPHCREMWKPRCRESLHEVDMKEEDQVAPGQDVGPGGGSLSGDDEKWQQHVLPSPQEAGSPPRDTTFRCGDMAFPLEGPDIRLATREGAPTALQARRKEGPFSRTGVFPVSPQDLLRGFLTRCRVRCPVREQGHTTGHTGDGVSFK